jgi:glycogen debranching enzyme
LLYIVHPWEAGSDDSPRWDSWVGSSDWNRHEWTAFDIGLIPETTWGEAGDATWCTEFVVAPAGFNALVAHAFGEYAALTGDHGYAARRTELADLIDDHLWDETTGMWRDLPVVGGGSGDSGRIPTLDGILPALVTGNQAHAQRALRQLCAEGRFFAAYGPRFVPRNDPTYRADTYWRGAAWPQMSYLVWLAASRWGMVDCASGIAASATNGTISSGFSEYWNPESGAACGATPQTWSAVAAAYLHDALTP